MRRLYEVNTVFFITVIVLLSAPFIPWSSITSDSTVLMLISQLLIAAPTILYLVVYKRPYTEVVSFKKIGFFQIVLLVLLTIAVLPVMSFINLVSQLYASDVTSSTMTAITSNQPFFISLFTIAVIPAFLEESVYRGMFYQEYRKWNPRAAIILSAFMFGVLHGNLNQFTYAFFMGIVFALIIEATDSIVSSMIIHFIINGNSVLILTLAGRMNTESSDIIKQASSQAPRTLAGICSVYLLPAIAGAVVAFFLFRYLAVSCGRWDRVKMIFTNRKADGGWIDAAKEPAKIKWYHMITWQLAAALAVCTINMIAAEIMQHIPIK